MAEYVRRRRPPASHPYWARLHDRAHPPQLVQPIAVPAAVGLGVGLYAGLQPEFTAADAVKLAAEVAGGVAAAVFGLAVLILSLDAARQTPRPPWWTTAFLAGIGVAVATFVALFVVLLVMFLWYAACSGRGPWVGLLIGGTVGGVPAALIAVGARRRWQDRQSRWPRWERMRSSRRPPVLPVTAVAASAPPATESVPPLSPARERPIG